MKAFVITLGLAAALLSPQVPARVGRAAMNVAQKGAAAKEKSLKAEEVAESVGVDSAAVARVSAARLVEIMRLVADETPNWEDAAAAASVQAQVADIIWETEPDVAHAILLRAWDASGRVSDAQAERSPFRNYLPGMESRRTVIAVARRHAPDMAERWLAQMAEDAKEAKGETTRRGAFDDRTGRSMVLLEMAMREVTTNPQAAAELASASLQDGISYGLSEVLVSLQRRDPALARAVFVRALNRLRTAGMSDSNELLILTAYLFTPGITRAANTTADPTAMQGLLTRDASRITPLADSHPALAHEFLKLAAFLLAGAPLPSATANPTETARMQISAIGEILHFGSQRVPDIAPALEARRAEILQDARFASGRPASAGGSHTGESGMTHSTSEGSLRVEELEEAARRETNPQLRDIRFAEAAAATEPEKYERGFAIAGHISDASLRTNVNDWLAYRASVHFAKKGDGDRAFQLSRKTSDPAQRAAGLVLGAQALLKAKQTARAGELLDEALALSRKAEPDAVWTRIAFGIAATYARFDVAAGIESLGNAVRLMNKSPEKTEAANERAPLVKKFGGFRHANVNFTNGTTGFGLHAAVRALPPAQFEDVLIVLHNISERETRGKAIVTLCAQHLRPAL